MGKEYVLDVSEHGSSVLVVGPIPYANPMGGVSRHVEVLSRLEVLRHATFVDPGSTDGKMSWGLLGAFWGAIGLWSVARKVGAEQVWINTSIYPLAFLKLLLLLVGMRFAPACAVRVFFHGGRFETIPYLKISVVRLLSQVVLGRVSSFHFLSREQGRGFSMAFPGHQWRLFSNFVPESKRLPRIRRERKVFLFVGRMVKEKGLHEIVMAVEKLQKEGVCFEDLGFWFVGDGPELAMLRKAATSFPAGAFRTLGLLSSSELDSAYQSAYALVLPSYSEGFPYVIIEAMRAGLPIICTPTGALVDLVKAGENGFVVNVGDVAGLAEAVKTVACDELLAHRIGENNAGLFLKKLSGQAAEEFYRGLLCEPMP